MRVIRVVGLDPLLQGLSKGKRVIPAIGPDQVLLDGSHDPLGIRVAARVRPGREYLLDAE